MAERDETESATRPPETPRPRAGRGLPVHRLRSFTHVERGLCQRFTRIARKLCQRFTRIGAPAHLFSRPERRVVEPEGYPPR